MRIPGARPILAACGLLALTALPASGPAFAQAPELRAAAQVEVGSRIGDDGYGADVRVLTRRDLDRLPGRSVADVLRVLPGVDVARRGLEGTLGEVSLRGAGAAGTLVLVDGDPVSDPGSGDHALDLALPLDGVERIEVLYGDASALYGPGAIGGAVNIVTRGAEVGTANVQCETRLAHGTRSLDTGSYRGAGTLTRNIGIGFEIARGESSGGREGRELATESAHLAARLATPFGRVEASAAYTGRKFGARGFYVAAPEEQREATRTRTARATLTSERAGWSITSSLSVRAHHDDFTLDRDRPDLDETLSDTDLFRIRSSARRGQILGGTLAVGVEAWREAIHTSFVSAHRDSGALFAEWGRPFTSASPERGGVRLALRADAVEGFGSRLSPHLALSYAPLPHLRLRASAGLAYRPPTFGELFGRDVRGVGDPGLGVERARAADAGASLDLGPLTLDATAFVRRGIGVIDRTRSTDTEAFRTVALPRLETRGVTGTLELARGLPSFVTTLAVQGSALSLRGGAGAGPAVPGSVLDPIHVRWDGLVGVAVPGARLRAFTRVSYAARRSRGGAATQDARLGWQTLEGDILELYLEGEDLWNRRLEEQPGVPLDGRRLLAGFHLTW